MATKKTAPQASEAPFDRLGAQVLEDGHLALWPLEGASTTIWTIAHLGLGEWRQWREVAEASEVVDPLDLEAPELGVSTDGEPNSSPRDFEGVPGGAPPVEVDLASQSELGVGPVVVSASRELFGLCVLRVEDVSPSSFLVALRGPAELDFGPGVELALASFEGVASDEVRAPRLQLFSSSGFALTVSMTLDAWLVVWLARYWPMMLVEVVGSARAALVLPLRDESGLEVAT